MKSSSLAQFGIFFVALLYAVFPGAEAVRLENPNNLPVITVELLNNDNKVFKYPPPSPRIPHERLSVETPLSFSNESIIFWESKDFNNTGSGSGTEIKLRLKCEAPYLTKWTITTHSTANAEDTKPFYDINYSVKKLPRDQENPLLFPQSNRDGGEFLYSLTELTVNSFGPEFKGGFINCVNREHDSLKSQLYIFQRFGANDRLKSVDQISRGVEDLTYIPCIVYDPDVKITYRQFIPTRKEYLSLVASFTTYNWRLGHKRVSGAYKAGIDRARCYLTNDNNYYVEYHFIEKTKTLNGTIKLTQSSNQVENISSSDFVCTIENRDQAPGASIELEPCVSPDYCFSGSSANTNSDRNNNGERDAQIQGKVSCSPQIQDYYFTGLSGKIYLLSQSPALPHDDLISMSIFEDTDRIRISCSAVKFLTSEPIEFSIRYPSNPEKPPTLLRNEFPSVSEGRVDWAKSVYTKTVVLDFYHVEDVQGLSCHVPWFNSEKWISVEKNLEHRYFGGKQIQIPSGSNKLKTTPNPYQEINTGSFHNRERLIQNVFHTEAKNDYTWNYPSNLTVQLGISLISLSLQANLFKSILHTNVLLRQLWIDPRFQWNPADYGGQHEIIIASGKILKPDIKLLNSVTLPSIESCAQHTNIHVSNEGQILWITPCQFISTCNFSGSSPNPNSNSNTCSLKFGTWSDDGFVKDIQFYKNKPEVDLELYEGGTLWNVTGSAGQRVEKTIKGGYGDIFPASLKFDIEFHEEAMSSYGR